MREAIAVPVDGREPIEQIVPVIESLAKPDMRVVFLVRSRTNGWGQLNAQLTVINTGNMIAFQNAVLWERMALEQERQSAEARLGTLCKNLRSHSLETEVRLYKGKVTKILGHLVQTDNVRFVLLPPARTVNPFARLGHAMIQFLNPVKLPVFWPLILIQSDAAVAKSR